MHIVDETYEDKPNFLGWYDKEGNFIPTKETIEAFKEAETLINSDEPGFNNFTDLWRDICAEEEDIEQVNKHIKLLPAIEEDLDLIIEAELYTTSAAYDTEELPQEVEDEIIQDSKDSLSHTRIITYDNKAIGILQAYELEGYWYIGEIYLIEEYRGQGIGREVLEYEISKHRDMTICLNVYKNNTHAIELYKSLGFEITEDSDGRYIMKLFPETNERVDTMKLRIKESISGRIEDTGERCVMEPTGYWIGANGRHITSYERVDKEIEYDRDGNPVKRQYSMDRQHRFWIETEDRVKEY